MSPLGYGLLQFGLMAASLAGLFRLMLPRHALFSAGARLLGDAFCTAPGRRASLAVGGFVLLGMAQNLVDPWFTEQAQRLHGVEDFSRVIYALEGGLTAQLQWFAPPALVAFFLYVYVSLFPALYACALLVPHALRRLELVGVAAGALLLNQLLALPFFMLLTVRETWYAELGVGVQKARLLTLELDPAIEPLFRDMRGIENNFPSLHTSIALTAWLVLRRVSPRAGVVAGVVAGLVMFSTLYLGFHWVCDMLAGAAHAWVCVWLATRWQQRSAIKGSAGTMVGSTP